MAYSNTRYRYSPKLITPIQQYPEIQQIEKIQPVEKIEPFYRYQGLDEKRRTYERLRQDKQTQTFLANYNDPTELNSYIDALTNREAVSKKFGDTWGTLSTLSGTVAVLSFAGSIVAKALIPFTGGASAAAVPVLKTIAAVAAIPAVPAAIDVTVEKGIKPIIAGKPKEAGLNMLMNLGETMDYAANPVKGLILEGGEGFIKGTGLGSEGRVNYDYNTGSFITDMLLELVTDPMNWIDLGGGAILKKSTKELAKPLAKQYVDLGVEAANSTLIKELSGEITEAQAQQMTKKITKSVTQAIRELNATPLKELTDEARKAALDKAHKTIRDSLVSAFREVNPKLTNKELNLIFNSTQDLVTNKQLTKTIFEEINDLTMDQLSSNIIQSLSGMLQMSDEMQKFMTRGALMTSGYGGSLLALKKGFDPALKHLQSLRLQKLAKANLFNKETGFDLTQYAKAKKYWELSSAYNTSIARDVDEASNQTFYRALEAQLNSNQSAIQSVCREFSKDPIKLAAKLDALAQQIQPNIKGGFQEYIAVLKGINDTEGGFLTDYIKRLESQYNTITVNAQKIAQGKKIYSAGAVVTNYSLKNFDENSYIKDLRDDLLQNLKKLQNKKHKAVDTQYALKMDDSVVNGMILNTTSIMNFVDEVLDTSTGYGAALENILKDLMSKSDDASAELRDAVIRIKQSAQSLRNLEQLYNSVGTITNLPVDLDPDQFYRFLLNEIMGLQGTVSDLYINFEATITQLYGNIEKLYADTGKPAFNLFEQAPALDNEIRTALKNFLEAQYDAGIDYLKTGVLEDLSDCLSTVSRHADSNDALKLATMMNYTDAVTDIYNLRYVKEFNDANLSITGTQKAFIELGYGDAELTMLGLARRTIIDDAQLKLFDYTTDTNGIIYAQAREIAHRIMTMAERAKQHSYAFTPEVAEQIKKAYTHLLKYNIPTFSSNALFDNYKHLVATDDIYTMYATLCEVNKAIGITNRAERNGFSVMLEACISDADLKFNIKHPDQFLRTEYIKDPVGYSVKFVNKQFRDENLNLIQKWQNFTAGTSKIKNDMQAVRELYATADADKVKNILLNRYVQMLDRVNTALNYLQDVNTRLYDAEIVKTNTELIYKAFNEYPELQARYQDVVDTVESYWAGDKTLTTALDPKLSVEYIRKRRELIGEYFKEHKEYPGTAARQEIDRALKTQFPEQAIDEYTALSDDFSMMLSEIETKAQDELFANNTELKRLQSEAYTELKHNTEALLPVRDPKYGDIAGTPNKDKDSLLGGWLETYEDGSARWHRTKSSAEPYETTQEYNPEFDAIDGSKYHEDKDFYITSLYNHYQDADYADLRYEYNRQYTVAWKIRDLLYTQPHATELNAQLKKMCTIPGSPTEGIPEEFFPQDFATALATYKYTIQQYGDDLQQAKEYILRQAYLPDLQKSRHEYYKTLSKTDKQIFWHYAAYTENILKKNDKLPINSLEYYNKFYNTFNWLINKDLNSKKFSLYPTQDVLNLKKLTQKQFVAEQNIMYAPLNKVINQVQSDFRAEMGQQVQKLLNDKFAPIKQKIYDDYIAAQTKTNALLEATHISLKDPFKAQIEYNRAIEKATNARALNTLSVRLQCTPEKMFNDLAYSFGQFVFSQDDLATIKYNTHQFKRLIADYKKIGIEYVEAIDKETNKKWHMFYIKDWDKLKMSGRQVYYDTNPVRRVQVFRPYTEYESVDKFIVERLGEDKQVVNELYKNIDNDMFEITGSNLGYSQGEIFDKNSFTKYYNALPEEFQNALGKNYLEYMTDPMFFQTIRFNESLTGTLGQRLERKLYANNAVFSARDLYNQAGFYKNKKIEFTNTVFDSAFSVNSSVYEGFSDEDLLAALQLNTDYKLIALVDDKKYGIRVQEIYPTSIDAIKKARELNAVVVPLQIYKEMYNTVNHRLGSSGFAQFWARVIYVYKFGYLCRPGAWLRNWFDTNIKSKLEMKGEHKIYMERAHTILNEFDSIQEYILEHRFKDIDGEEMTLRSVIQSYFENNKNAKISYEQYLELQDNYFSQGVADNVMQQFIQELNGTTQGDAWTAFTQLTGRILEKPNSTERYNRLAIYLYELDHGADYTTALSKLSKIHFDYSFKTKAEQLVDMVFPFTTFSLRNYSYWFEMVEKYPWLLRNYAHIMKPHYDFKDYTPEELARDQRAQSQILNGQLKLDVFSNNLITFKANPSIQNALSMFSDPINMVYENLAAPISVPLKLAQNEYVQPLNSLPIAGPAIQSAKTMVKTGSPMPSAIGVQKKSSYAGNVKFKNKNLSGVNKCTDKTYRTPKYRNNYVFDSYATKGITRYRLNMYPIVDVYHDIKMRVSTNVYNRIKNRVKTDVYKGIRYQLRLDANRLR